MQEFSEALVLRFRTPGGEGSVEVLSFHECLLVAARLVAAGIWDVTEWEWWIEPL